MVDGQILNRDFQLVQMDAAEVTAEALPPQPSS